MTPNAYPQTRKTRFLPASKTAAVASGSAALCLLLLSPCLQAQTLRVVCSEIAPYCFVDNGINRGFIYEIGQELLRRLELPVRIEIQPLARSLHTVQENSKVVSLWVGRIPERENTVRWIAPVFNDAFYIFAL